MKKVIFITLLTLFVFGFVGCGEVDTKSMVVELEITSANSVGFLESNFIKELEEEISRFVVVNFETLSQSDLEVLTDCLKSKWGVEFLVDISFDKANHSILIFLGDGVALSTSKSLIMLPLSDCKV